MSGEAETENGRIVLNSAEEVASWLKANGRLLFVQNGEVQSFPGPHRTNLTEFALAEENGRAVMRFGDETSGLGSVPSGVLVSQGTLSELTRTLSEEGSDIRRLSSWPITRAFVYLDISEFSKVRPGVQVLVVQSLLRISAQAEKDVSGNAEAKLCIGDGYIYVWDEAVAATRFAGYLAREIEDAVARNAAPEFHFRIGVHIGPVRCFWDPGRNGWNYVGQGINGGNRVLAAIGKETDDVVFVSGEVRSALIGSHGAPLRAHLLNRGRKADKHGGIWRVYELNHSAPI